MMFAWSQVKRELERCQIWLDAVPAVREELLEARTFRKPTTRLQSILAAVFLLLRPRHQAPSWFDIQRELLTRPDRTVKELSDFDRNRVPRWLDRAVQRHIQIAHCHSGGHGEWWQPQSTQPQGQVLVQLTAWARSVVRYRVLKNEHQSRVGGTPRG